MRGSSFCFHHRRGAVTIASDTELTQRNLKILGSASTGRNRERALKSLRRIARWEIYRLWKLDPRAPAIDLLQLSESDEKRVAQWLKDHHHIELDKPLPGSDRLATPRARDRLRWAAWRVIARGDAASPDFIRRAHYRCVAAVRDDAKFWTKLAKLEASKE